MRYAYGRYACEETPDNEMRKSAAPSRQPRFFRRGTGDGDEFRFGSGDGCSFSIKIEGVELNPLTDFVKKR
ncbi:MAG TPA: hypothetical protein DCM49_00145 [Lachnospiraceae bacterium]|nr:hypothetical protein [Lachnospiraceae bacterium]